MKIQRIYIFLDHKINSAKLSVIWGGRGKAYNYILISRLIRDLSEN